MVRQMCRDHRTSTGEQDKQSRCGPISDSGSGAEQGSRRTSTGRNRTKYSLSEIDRPSQKMIFVSSTSCKKIFKMVARTDREYLPRFRPKYLPFWMKKWRSMEGKSVLCINRWSFHRNGDEMISLLSPSSGEMKKGTVCFDLYQI